MVLQQARFVLNIARLEWPDYIRAALVRRVIILMVGCGMLGCTAAGPGPGVPALPLPAVSNLRVVPQDESLLLAWDVARPDHAVFSGYNIYLSERPVLETPDEQELLQRIRPVNRLPYPGDTDPDLSHETYSAEGLDNGVRYYCFVRAVSTDGRLGRPTNEVMAICRRGGEAKLQKLFSGAFDGFDFSSGRYVNSDAIDCDVAFYHKDGVDHLVAPYRIDPLLNETRFWDLGAQSFDGVAAPALKGDGSVEVEPRTGHVYAFKLADGHYGKLRITTIEDLDGLRTIRFNYMVQSIPNLVDLR